MGNVRVSTLRAVATSLYFAANFVHHQMHLESQGIVTDETRATNYHHHRTDSKDSIMYGSHSRHLQSFEEGDMIYCDITSHPNFLGTMKEFRQKPGDPDPKSHVAVVKGSDTVVFPRGKCKASIKEGDKVFCRKSSNTWTGTVGKSDVKGVMVNVKSDSGKDGQFQQSECEPYKFANIKQYDEVDCKLLRLKEDTDQSVVSWKVWERTDERLHVEGQHFGSGDSISHTDVSLDHWIKYDEWTCRAK